MLKRKPLKIREREIESHLEELKKVNSRNKAILNLTINYWKDILKEAKQELYYKAS